MKTPWQPLITFSNPYFPCLKDDGRDDKELREMLLGKF